MSEWGPIDSCSPDRLSENYNLSLLSDEEVYELATFCEASLEEGLNQPSDSSYTEEERARFAIKESPHYEKLLPGKYRPNDTFTIGISAAPKLGAGFLSEDGGDYEPTYAYAIEIASRITYAGFLGRVAGELGPTWGFALKTDLGFIKRYERSDDSTLGFAPYVFGKFGLGFVAGGGLGLEILWELWITDSDGRIDCNLTDKVFRGFGFFIEGGYDTDLNDDSDFASVLAGVRFYFSQTARTLEEG